ACGMLPSAVRRGTVTPVRRSIFLLLPCLVGLVALGARPGPSAAQARVPVWRTEPGGPTLRVSARAETGVQPKSVNVSPDGRRVVVCNFGRPDHDNVSVYDALTLAPVGTVSFE